MGRPLRAVPAQARLLLPALAAALDGSGPAVLPLPPQPDRVLAALRPGEPLEDDGVALVVPTSGSTGEPKGVLLSAAALRASGEATSARLGGPARWLLALPPTHIGGLQVLVRSLLAGTDPVLLPDAPFTAGAFVAATGLLGGGRRCVSLVPTQLRRLLEDAPATAALSTYDAVLLGGAAARAALLSAAREAGVRVVTTYGMSETAGGCVYDGLPLDGVRVAVHDGLIRLAGPVLASGYRLRPDLTAEAFSGGEFRTSDVGVLGPDGLLTVLGRADDVIVSGGEKVPPAAVEAALEKHASVVEAGVVGVPDDEWGERVVAFVVLRGPLSPTEARAQVARSLPRTWAPRELREVEQLPLLPTGKIDRAALRSGSRPTTRLGT
jgi:O-succinylbenzoic acid--CoA ligase